jgi:hypothetical protein
MLDQYQLNKHAPLGTQHITSETSFLAEKARQFLLVDNTRFPAVCNLAGLDPSHVRTRARKVTNDVDLRLKIVTVKVTAPVRHISMQVTV